MAYVDQNGSANRTKAIVGVVAIHAALGTIVVTGLSTVIPLVTTEPPIRGFHVPLDPPPPPEPDQPEVTRDSTQKQDIFVPDRKFTFDSNVDVSVTDKQPDEGFVFDPEPIGTGPVDLFPQPTPTPTMTFDPIVAKPNNNPGGWVTTADYKSSWIRRELQGVVSFALNVDANGRASDCRVTRSSGHAELDDATCRLVRQRARFTAARDGKGIKVPGSYSNSVRWELPD